MSRSQIKKRYSDKKSRNRKLEIGEKVLLLLPTSNNKLLMQWQGPLIVRDKVGEYDYRVEDKNGKIKTYHINMLKKYIDRRDMLEEKANVEKDRTRLNSSHSQISYAVFCLKKKKKKKKIIH